MNRLTQMDLLYAKDTSASSAMRTILQERPSRIHAKKETMKDTSKPSCHITNFEPKNVGNLHEILMDGLFSQIFYSTMLEEQGSFFSGTYTADKTTICLSFNQHKGRSSSSNDFFAAETLLFNFETFTPHTMPAEVSVFY